jgi:hypothetical protein
MTPDFFARAPKRYSVPHDRIGVRWVLVAHQAISKAFEIIRKNRFALGAASENDITVELENVLNNQVRNQGEVEGFDGDFWGKIRRVETVNFDGTKKSKRPDLCFDLQRENNMWDQLQDALFAECKPVDKRHLLKDHYCAVGKDCTGIERFIIGDYGWSMEEVMMIAYVRDNFSVVPHLEECLKSHSQRTRLGTPSSIESVTTTPALTVPLYHTVHHRTFTWRDGSPATKVLVYHSWHDCC